MAASIQEIAQFDPSADIDEYLADEAASLRRRGLTRPTIDLYVLLCRLCLPGSARLLYGYQSDLAADLRRLAPNVRGLTESQLCRKLATLADLGFIAKTGGGPWGDELVIVIQSPETVAERQKPRRTRRPQVAATPDTDRQGRLFDDEPAAIRIYSPQDEPAQPSLKSQSIVISAPESQSIVILEQPKPIEHTSYTRTHACAPAVETRRVETCRVDVDTSATFLDERAEEQVVTPEEHAAAQLALRDMERTWGRVGLRPAKEPDQRAEDRALYRRAHVLVQRGRIPEHVLAEAAARPVDLRRQGRSVRKPAAVMTKRLFAHPGFRELVGQIREPLPSGPPGGTERTGDAAGSTARSGEPGPWMPLPREHLQPHRPPSLMPASCDRAGAPTNAAETALGDAKPPADALLQPHPVSRGPCGPAGRFMDFERARGDLPRLQEVLREIAGVAESEDGKVCEVGADHGT